MTSKALSNNFSTKNFLSKLRAYDQEAIENLINTYTSHLYKAALGLGLDQNQAQEVVQNVWTTFYEKIDNFQGRSHIRTYLFGILYNKIREHKRERFKYVDNNDPIEEIMETKFSTDNHFISGIMPNPDKMLEMTESLEIIDQCLEKLPLNQKVAFKLKEVDGLKTKEICNILEITGTNLGVLLYRGRNRLRECIERLFNQ